MEDSQLCETSNYSDESCYDDNKQLEVSIVTIFTHLDHSHVVIQLLVRLDGLWSLGGPPNRLNCANTLLLDNGVACERV